MGFRLVLAILLVLPTFSSSLSTVFLSRFSSLTRTPAFKEFVSAYILPNDEVKTLAYIGTGLAAPSVNCDSCSSASSPNQAASASDAAMNMIPGVVRANVNKAVQLVVRRRRRRAATATTTAAAAAATSSNVVLTLKPRVWSGRGLLECHLSKMF